MIFIKYLPLVRPKWVPKLKVPRTATLCPSVSVGCAPVASPVDNFAESASPVPIYAFPANL